MVDREQIFELAIADVNSGKISSIRAAANKYGLPRSTLQDRIKGKVPVRVAHKH